MINSDNNKPTDSLTPNQRENLVTAVGTVFGDIGRLRMSGHGAPAQEVDSRINLIVHSALEHDPAPKSPHYGLMLHAIGAGATRTGQAIQRQGESFFQYLDQLKQTMAPDSPERATTEAVMSRLNALHSERVRNAFGGQSDPSADFEAHKTAYDLTSGMQQPGFPEAAKEVAMAGVLYAAQAAPLEVQTLSQTMKDYEPMAQAAFGVQ